MAPRDGPCLPLVTVIRQRLTAVTTSPLAHPPAQEMEVDDLTVILHMTTEGKVFDVSGMTHMEWLPTNLLPEQKREGSRGSRRSTHIYRDTMVDSHPAMVAATYL